MIFSFVQFIILIILVLENSKTLVYSFSNITDQQALLSIKASIKTEPLGVLDSWNNSVHFCHWAGVTCSPRRQRVTTLNLSSQHLVGTFSPHIGNLSFLWGINLDSNNFHGSIPNEIGLLFRLKYLYLSDNHFEGRFPANLSHCARIRQIDISLNNIEGEVPSEFASWPKLNYFYLRDNHFTGPIPPSIGNISSLRVLSLSANNLAGNVPLQLAYHTILQSLDLAINNLTGMVPPSLYNISSLYTLGLNHNVFEGTLPSDLGSTLPKLQEFYAESNKFSGACPPSFANASNLVIFQIQKNIITGPIPNNLGSLFNLRLLNLGNNPIGNDMQPDDWSFFNSLVNCTYLKKLALQESGLRGELPNSISNLSTTMEELYLYRNHIHGTIPHEIKNLKNMRVISWFDNLLTGTIPESLGELSELGVLDLQNNTMSGLIPSSIGNITHLVDLALQNNMLQGSMPSQLFNISTLERVFLGKNRLSGVIPDQIVSSSRCISLDLSWNLFNGQLPSNIGSFKQLGLLEVSYNKLTGDIPTTLGACVMLEDLYMQGNLLQGKIPSSFQALRNLAFLDLSNNNISGGIPRFFDGFRLIIFLDLSHNKFEGEVSKKGLFSNASAFSVIGNLKLCGGIQALHLSACPEKVSRSNKKGLALKIILILVLVPLGMLLTCFMLISYRRRNSKKLSDPVTVLKDDQYPKLSYQDLLRATNEFSPENMIGAGKYGSVYKGFLESLEHTIAVKVLNIEIRGANKTFLAECETLRNIRHRNLIKIITACSSTDFKGNDFKALVFEFMTNGSLDSWLHPSPSYQGHERNLSLLQRLNISIDVALGVDYLHHQTHESIIHCDLKPSNILLDEGFVACIGDFGLARFCFSTTTSDITQTQISSTGVRGTIGYVPPEYGMCGEISAKGDVYSYGILLLEMFSGKRPTESNILMDNENNLHDFVRKALPQNVMDIVDPRIILDQQEHDMMTVNQSYSRAAMEVCLTSILEVGVLCSEETPRNRIDINIAIKQLHVAREKLLQSRQ